MDTLLFTLTADKETITTDSLSEIVMEYANNYNFGESNNPKIMMRYNDEPEKEVSTETIMSTAKGLIEKKEREIHKLKMLKIGLEINSYSWI